MSTDARNSKDEGVVFSHEPDGRVTAKDMQTGVSSYGDTRSEALRMLADAIESHEAAGEFPDEDVPESDAPWL